MGEDLSLVTSYDMVRDAIIAHLDPHDGEEAEEYLLCIAVEEAAAEVARLRADLRDIARYVMKNQDAIRDGNDMMELARMLDAALDGGKE